MKKILTIAKKEWRNYFSSPVGYVFAALLLMVTMWIYLGDIFLMAQADLRPYVMTMAFLFSIFIPAISMGLLADEKKSGTWEVVLSLPVNEFQLVVGKFLGCGLYLLFTIMLSLSIVVTIAYLGKPDWGIVVTGFGGLLVLGLAYLSVGLFMSSLSSQAIVGFLGATVFLIINNMFGQEAVISRLPTVLQNIAEKISLSGRLVNINAGLVTLSDLIFFISWITIFLILTILSLKTRDK